MAKRPQRQQSSPPVPQSARRPDQPPLDRLQAQRLLDQVREAEVRIQRLLSQLELRERALDEKIREAGSLLSSSKKIGDDLISAAAEAHEVIAGMRVAVKAFARVEIKEEVTAALRDELDGLVDEVHDAAQGMIDAQARKIHKAFDELVDVLMGVANVVNNGSDMPTIPESVAGLMHRARVAREEQRRKAGL